MSIWDDPDLQPPTENYVKLEQVGDGFTGLVTKVEAKKFDDGSVAPHISFLDDADGEEWAWTAGQIQSKKQLADLRPEPGDRIRVRLNTIESRGSKKLKHISIEVVERRNGAPETRAAQTDTTSVAADVRTYHPAPAPVYATNDNGNGAGTNPTYYDAAAAQPMAAPVAVPTGVDPAVWARMTDTQRQQLLDMFGAVPAF